MPKPEEIERRKARLQSIKELIQGVGLNDLPSYRELAQTYNVSQTVICKDIRAILKDLDNDAQEDLKLFIAKIREKYKQVEKQAFKHVFDHDPKTSLKACHTWTAVSSEFLNNLKRLGFKVDLEGNVNENRVNLVMIQAELYVFLEWLETKNLVDSKALDKWLKDFEKKKYHPKPVVNKAVIEESLDNDSDDSDEDEITEEEEKKIG
jgi:hypothetical protein